MEFLNRHPSRVTLEEGTVLTLRLAESLSTGVMHLNLVLLVEGNSDPS